MSCVCPPPRDPSEVLVLFVHCQFRVSGSLLFQEPVLHHACTRLHMNLADVTGESFFQVSLYSSRPGSLNSSGDVEHRYHIRLACERRSWKNNMKQPTVVLLDPLSEPAPKEPTPGEVSQLQKLVPVTVVVAARLDPGA